MAQRQYVIGLPVIVTVDDDLGIVVEVDMSEAGSEIAEYDSGDYVDGNYVPAPESVDEQSRRDAETVNARCDARASAFLGSSF